MKAEETAQKLACAMLHQKDRGKAAEWGEGTGAKQNKTASRAIFVHKKRNKISVKK